MQMKSRWQQKANKVENCTKKKTDNNEDVRSRERILHVCVWVCEYANVIKLRSRREAGSSDGAQHEIRKTRVTISILVLPSTTWKEVPELRILLHRQVCHLRSHRTVREEGEYTFWASCVITEQHQAGNAETLEDSPFQTWLHTSRTPTSWSWSNAGPSRALAAERPLKAAWINLEIREDFSQYTNRQNSFFF